MGCTGIRAHSGCNGNRVEGQPAQGCPDGSKGEVMDAYTAAGFAAVALVSGLVSARVIRDEWALHRKRVLSRKY